MRTSEPNREFWKPLFATGPDGGCLIDVTALADIMAGAPERMSWPKTRAPWSTRSAKRRRKREREPTTYADVIAQADAVAAEKADRAREEFKEKSERLADEAHEAQAKLKWMEGRFKAGDDMHSFCGWMRSGFRRPSTEHDRTHHR
ncbi:hypothetical protein ACIHAR_09485 [Streptomyces sp. NPDC052016]|uniref:hypothetical protein n=1 Tax=Streptomyces sp. NPDC052016 TaxID=3365680 RepID=UPI0037D6A54F